MSEFKYKTIKIKKSQINAWAERYPVDYDAKVEGIALQVRARGYYLKDELIQFCRWKTPRSGPRVAKNTEGYIQAVTQTALSTPDERLRIEVLTLLEGVSWPTASVLLHFGHHDRYPILDYRALWSLGVEASQVRYDFSFWWEYTRFCRRLADKAGVSVRILDRALWQYSKSNQG